MMEAREATTKAREEATRARDEFDRKKNDYLDQLLDKDEKIRVLSQRVGDIEDGRRSNSTIPTLNNRKKSTRRLKSSRDLNSSTSVHSIEETFIEIRKQNYKVMMVCQTMVDNCCAMECSKCHNLFETNNFFNHLASKNGDGC